MKKREAGSKKENKKSKAGRKKIKAGRKKVYGQEREMWEDKELKQVSQIDSRMQLRREDVMELASHVDDVSARVCAQSHSRLGKGIDGI